MPAPTVVSDFLDCVRKSGVADPTGLDEFLAAAGADGPATPAQMADALVREGLLTRFQADQMLRGRWRNFILAGKYAILEPLGAGGMGTVYLCSHKIMRRPVAIKVLPASQADDPGSVERFHREAQAVAQLRHPNIVGAHDIDRDGKFHFLVMEYVDGVSLQELVRRRGPLEPNRAAHYIHQAALGLQHAHEAAGLVHRDIKPANLLVDRTGVVKILDLGLARFFHDKKESVTQKYDGNAVLGTADYLAPEQAVDSHNVDIRCDIYSLGITFYFLLAGHSPFQEGSVAEKLIWHQVRQPKPIREVRPDVPEGMAAVLAKMIAKEPSLRYQEPAEVAEALAPWTDTPLDPPSDKDIPQISAAARRAGVSDVNYTAPRTPAPGGQIKPASSGRRGPPATAPEETNSRSQGLTGTIPTHATMKSIQDAPSSRGNGQSEKADAPMIRARRFPWVIVAAAAAFGLLLLIGVVSAVAWIALGPAETAPPLGVAPPMSPDQRVQQPVPPPPRVDLNPALPPAAGVVALRQEDGLHFRGAHYEAVVDPEGGLNSLRVGGVEFLHPGEPVAGGKSVAKGAYFYSEKAGHQGAVQLPHVERPADNVVVASGDKFSVRYEFGPDEVVVKPSNNTDDDVPFYLILDGDAVTDVLVGADPGRRLSVPVARKMSDPLDPAWQTTTWIAGCSRLKISDGTRVWGPWGRAGNLQVWERALPTYGSAAIHLTPIITANEQDASVPPGGVVLTRHYTTRRVRTDLYEAVVEGDGCLSSLRVDGVEFLHPGLNVSRGSYFLHGAPATPQRLTDIRQPTANVLTADGANASIRYEFGPDKMTWTLENKANAAMPFYFVFDSGVTAVRVGADAWLKTPGAKQTLADAKTPTAWYAGRGRVTLTGGNRIWGPWFDKYQVWEVSMQPHEKRTMTVELARAPAAEVDKAAATAGVQPAAASELALYAPLDYQVFQRQTRTQGNVRVRGRTQADFDRVEWRLTGKPLEGAAPFEWQALPASGERRAFDATVPAPAGGWYKLEVRALKDGKEIALGAIDHIGVGEVFVGAGQSNSTNCGQEKTRQHTGMVSSFGGTSWQPADDPQLGAHDDSVGGSFWPAFGDAMAEKYHVPIGVASTGHSGTSINQWQPGDPMGLFDWTTERMNELGKGGFRAVLWHQGESDVGMASDEYREKLTNLIEKSRGAAGWDAPWFVAQVSYHNPKETSFPSTRDAQQKLWQTGVALEGPDTDTLTGDDRDTNGQGIHFSPKGLTAHGRMWADKVGVWLDKVLAK